LLAHNLASRAVDEDDRAVNAKGFGSCGVAIGESARLAPDNAGEGADLIVAPGPYAVGQSRVDWMERTGILIDNK
jgi:hypothetical protein